MLIEQAWELDGLRLRVTVAADSGVAGDQPPASFGWASAVAKRSGGAAVAADSVTIDGLTVLCVWLPDALAAGPWHVQVRAGAAEISARTIYDASVTLRSSIRMP